MRALGCAWVRVSVSALAARVHAPGVKTAVVMHAQAAVARIAVGVVGAPIGVAVTVPAHVRVAARVTAPAVLAVQVDVMAAPDVQAIVAAVVLVHVQQAVMMAVLVVLAVQIHAVKGVMAAWLPAEMTVKAVLAVVQAVVRIHVAKGVMAVWLPARMIVRAVLAIVRIRAMKDVIVVAIHIVRGTVKVRVLVTAGLPAKPLGVFQAALIIAILAAKAHVSLVRVNDLLRGLSQLRISHAADMRGGCVCD